MTVLLAALFFPGGASAGTDDRSVELADTADPNAEFLAADLHISLEEATRRSLLQDTFTSFSVEVQKRVPTAFAGSVIESRSTGRLTVHLTDPGIDLSAETKRWGIQGLVDVVKARYSLNELAIVGREVYNLLPETGAAIHSFDLPTNSLRVQVSTADESQHLRITSALREYQTDRPGVLTIDETDVPLAKAKDQQEASCASAAGHDTLPLKCDSHKGGLEMVGSPNDVPAGTHVDWPVTGACSAGFNVVGDSGQHYILTAGHCVRDFKYWWLTRITTANSHRIDMAAPSSHTFLGTRHATWTTTAGDWGLVKVDGADAGPGRVYSMKNDDSPFGPHTRNPDYPIVGVGAATTGSGPDGITGDSICRTGRSTGSICGYVTATVFSSWSEMTGRGRLVEYWDEDLGWYGAVCEGDSGGPVYRNSLGYGITSAYRVGMHITTVGYPIGPLSSDKLTCGGQMIYTSLGGALDFWPISLVAP